MPIRASTPSRSRGSAKPRPTQCAEAFAEALLWRAQWQAEREAGRNRDERAGAPPEPMKPHKREAAATARFAGAMARAELGRFHWDEAREAEFRKAAKLPRRPRGAR
jgi:hypothetical protein